ncbi:hypothetical protein [Bacillus sp. 1NLA3E]|uniref:hypothetical protein n=1 Tax=Bacillus sp. 1NLA3E TaxID=666686 RepID=UPI000247E897|nr:hypothetical protein [Bacillus sp. 1NLA3E]AGK53321.1 hypothetical protein B1NLA3E_07795 [Bacillus sp. 1NLA3E]
MLNKEMKKYISEIMGEQEASPKTIELYKEEKEYIEKNHLIEAEVNLIEKNSASRFADAYIERGDKEQEEVIAEETAPFLEQPIDYFKKHKNEFIYVESKWFDLIGVDAVAFEADDVFGTYDVMLGLKLQKKFEPSIKEFLQNSLHNDGAKFDLMFDQGDGLWSLNFALNFVEGFNEEMSMREAYGLIYQFLFKLDEAVEQK